MKLICWNVNGLRSIQKKGFEDFVKKEKPDILCLQETKIGINQWEGIDTELSGYAEYYSSGNRNGYSGVATYVRENSQPVKKEEKGIGVKKFDNEGRFIITDHGDFVLYNTYIPSGSSGEERQKFKYKFLDAFYEHLSSQKKKKKFIICGDFNICHREIDIHHPETAAKRELSGFLPKERAWMDRFVDAGFVDSYRHINGDKSSVYSWWTYRAGARGKNLGWRIDYVFTSEPLAKKIGKASIHTTVMGSDHCPVSIELKL